MPALVAGDEEGSDEESDDEEMFQKEAAKREKAIAAAEQARKNKGKKSAATPVPDKGKKGGKPKPSSEIKANTKAVNAKDSATPGKIEVVLPGEPVAAIFVFAGMGTVVFQLHLLVRKTREENRKEPGPWKQPRSF